jgi:hypothetical protein
MTDGSDLTGLTAQNIENANAIGAVATSLSEFTPT